MLHDVSRRLALLLEGGMSEGASDPEAEKIPVLLSHPLDPFEEDEALGKRTTAVLYPIRIVPERGLRRPGMSYVPPSPGGGAEGFRGETLWVRMRFVFTVAGGSLEGQLGAVEAALRTVHDNPVLDVGTRPRRAHRASPAMRPAVIHSASSMTRRAGGSWGWRSTASSSPSRSRRPSSPRGSSPSSA